MKGVYTMSSTTTEVPNTTALFSRVDGAYRVNVATLSVHPLAVAMYTSASRSDNFASAIRDYLTVGDSGQAVLSGEGRMVALVGYMAGSTAILVCGDATASKSSRYVAALEIINCAGQDAKLTREGQRNRTKAEELIYGAARKALSGALATMAATTTHKSSGKKAKAATTKATKVGDKEVTSDVIGTPDGQLAYIDTVLSTLSRTCEKRAEGASAHTSAILAAIANVRKLVATAQAQRAEQV